MGLLLVMEWATLRAMSNERLILAAFMVDVEPPTRATA